MIDTDKQISKSSELVMYIVINKDLHMSAGKIAAQTGHVIVKYMCDYMDVRGIFEPAGSMVYCTEEELLKYQGFKHWIVGGQPKVVLGADQQMMEKLIEKYKVYSIHDEGRTEIPPDSLTALCFPPMQRKDAPKEIRRLQLYKDLSIEDRNYLKLKRAGVLPRYIN